MPRLHDEIKDRIKEMDSMTDILSPALSMAIPPYFNSSRKIIYNHNMGHAVNLIEPSFPRVYTGFEKIFGSYSEMYEKADADYEIFDKFVRNKYNYLLPVYDKKNKVYDIIERVAYEEFSENYAVRYNNDYLDSLGIGDSIHKGDTVKKSTSFDDHDNYSIGKTLNTLAWISTATEEDCITLMNGAEKMMDTYNIHVVRVPITRDEVMVNLYGDKENYKPFPNIGEKVKDGMLLATRKMPTNSTLFSGKDKHLKKTAQGDKIIYIDGKVIDFTIYNNAAINEMPDSKIYDKLRESNYEQQKFHLDLYEYLSKLVYEEGDNYTCGPQIRYWLSHCTKFVDASAYFIDSDNVFGHIIMEFKVLQRNHLLPGSKLTGLDGEYRHRFSN